MIVLIIIYFVSPYQQSVICNYNYSQVFLKFIVNSYSMILSLLLSFLASFIHTAIIQSSLQQNTSFGAHSPPFSTISTVTKLTQNYLYKLTIFQRQTSGDKTIQAFVSFVKAGDNCGGFACYYGWINNYTQGSDTILGYSSFTPQTNPIFEIVLFLNKTFTITKASSLTDPLQTLLSQSIQLLNPIFAQFSNLNPYISEQNLSQLSLYSFHPIEAINNSQSIKDQVKTIMKLDTFKNNPFAEKIAIGWRELSNQQFTMFKDLIAIDQDNNQIIQRLVTVQSNSQQKPGSLDIQLQLVSNNIFTDLTAIKDNIAMFSNKSQNLEITSANLLASRLQLPLFTQ